MPQASRIRNVRFDDAVEAKGEMEKEASAV